MRRAWLVVLALAVPTLGGFECTIEGGIWGVGDTCTYWLDYADTECDGNSLIYCAEDDFVYSQDCASQCPANDGTCGHSDVLGYNACICPEAFVIGAGCDPATQGADYNTCVSTAQLAYCDLFSETVVGLDCASYCGASGGTGRCDFDWNDGSYQCLCESYVWADGYGCNFLFDGDKTTCESTTAVYCGEDNIIHARECSEYCVNDVGGTAGACGQMPGTSTNGCVCTIEACDFQPYCDSALVMVYCDPGTGAVWTDCDADCRSQGLTKGVCDFSTGQCSCI